MFFASVADVFSGEGRGQKAAPSTCHRSPLEHCLKLRMTRLVTAKCATDLPDKTTNFTKMVRQEDEDGSVSSLRQLK